MIDIEQILSYSPQKEPTQLTSRSHIYVIVTENIWKGTSFRKWVEGERKDSEKMGFHFHLIYV